MATPSSQIVFQPGKRWAFVYSFIHSFIFWTCLSTLESQGSAGACPSCQGAGHTLDRLPAYRRANTRKGQGWAGIRTPNCLAVRCQLSLHHGRVVSLPFYMRCRKCSTVPGVLQPPWWCLISGLVLTRHQQNIVLLLLCECVEGFSARKCTFMQVAECCLPESFQGAGGSCFHQEHTHTHNMYTSSGHTVIFFSRCPPLLLSAPLFVPISDLPPVPAVSPGVGVSAAWSRATCSLFITRKRREPERRRRSETESAPLSLPLILSHAPTDTTTCSSLISPAAWETHAQALGHKRPPFQTPGALEDTVGTGAAPPSGASILLCFHWCVCVCVCRPFV